MSPLDDELRTALASRTASVGTGPDFFAGVERRATRMRRQRVAATVAGSALAVTALGLGGPMLAGSLTSIADGPLDQATTQNVDDFALDPANPWPYRGDIVVQAPVEGVATSAWAEQQGVPVDEVRLSLLYGTLPGPPDLALAVYVASAADGRASWGLVRTDRRGVAILLDAALEPGTLPTPIALPVVLPGEAVQSLLVVAAPQTQVQYCPVLGDPCADAGEQGIAVVPLDGDRSRHGYRVLAPDGRVLDEGPAPYGEVVESEEPANLLTSWPSRGTELAPDLEARVQELFQAALAGLEGEPRDADVLYRPLFTGDTDGGVRFTVGQAWAVGGNAYTVAIDQGGTQGEQFFLGPRTDPDVPVIAALLCCQPGSTVDTLVVVPQPRTGQVRYDDDAQGQFRPVGEDQDYLDGVVLVDRDTRADDDRLQLLDGDGDLDAPTFEGPVRRLLCGVSECG